MFPSREGPRHPLGYRERLNAHNRGRRANDRAIIENPLACLTDAELEIDVRRFVTDVLPSVDYHKLLRAARVGRDIRLYDEAARQSAAYNQRNRLPVTLTDEEKTALRKEKDNTFSERGMLVVIATVSLAAFLQGFVQSSFNGASMYKSEFGLTGQSVPNTVTLDDWKLGAANASPWIFGALIGCPLSLPINYWFGRKGGISVAAFMILCSSVAAIFATSWTALFGIRIVNGLGMGIKAVSTPILASETAVGFWRGSAILAWQLWVAFGIMVSFAFNLLFTRASSDTITYRLIQGAPLVPSLALLVMALFVCPESPRYLLMKGPNYSVEKSFRELRKLRNTELQALRDMYLVYKSIQHENMDWSDLDPHARQSPGFIWVLRDFIRQFTQLFQRRRLRNALISTSTVNLAQQFCGVNENPRLGAINFLFALPAIRSIDTIGRRRWLNITLPFMAIFMLGAAVSGYIEDINTRIGITACFLFRLNVIALVMVFLFVEETKQRSLEELDHIFAVSKRRFIRFQATAYLPWAIRKCICGNAAPGPELYRDLVWGSMSSEEVVMSRMPDEARDDTELKHIGPRPTLVWAHQSSTSEQPHAAELAESYFPAIRVPYPT
ncbi:hypothetical protein E4U42_006080 [Claviceps africana]|uniref:Major facilitator superfamily (MFS) profile domain-containing protein n=1 Tax=Claviceps africana TaxID=83212 RepID=A0A8K0J2T3_9HYPO|nr:hypothetical protein E4U42_006080 [Claviceps africana]